jgi:hypothetical protein
VINVAKTKEVWLYSATSDVIARIAVHLQLDDRLYSSPSDVTARIAVKLQLDERLYSSPSEIIARIAVHIQLMTDCTAPQVK